MATGKLKMWNAERGYGFVGDASGGPDLFLHVSALESAGIDPLTIRKGDRLTYGVESTARERRGLATFGGRAEKWRLPTSGRRKSGKATSRRSQTSNGARQRRTSSRYREISWAASRPASRSTAISQREPGPKTKINSESEFNSRQRPLDGLFGT